MGTLNLGTNGKIQSTNIDLSGDWSNAPSGTIISHAYGTMGSSFSTTSDSQVATGLITSPLVKNYLMVVQQELVEYMFFVLVVIVIVIVSQDKMLL